MSSVQTTVILIAHAAEWPNPWIVKTQCQKIEVSIHRKAGEIDMFFQGLEHSALSFRFFVLHVSSLLFRHSVSNRWNSTKAKNLNEWRHQILIAAIRRISLD